MYHVFWHFDCFMCWSSTHNCYRHMDTTNIPFGRYVFLISVPIFWKIRHSQAPALLAKEARPMPRKILIFLASFLVGTTVYFLLSILMVEVAVNTTLPAWTGYVLYSLSIVMAVCVGVVIYRLLTRMSVDGRLR